MKRSAGPVSLLLLLAAAGCGTRVERHDAAAAVPGSASRPSVERGLGTGGATTQAPTSGDATAATPAATGTAAGTAANPTTPNPGQRTTPAAGRATAGAAPTQSAASAADRLGAASDNSSTTAPALLGGRTFAVETRASFSVANPLVQSSSPAAGVLVESMTGTASSAVKEPIMRSPPGIRLRRCVW